MNNFDEQINRLHTNSVKWDLLKEVYNLEDATDILPMWVADMDFQSPKEVTAAIKSRVESGVFGYSYISEECKNAITNWFSSRYSWTIDSEQLLFHPGVVPIIAQAVASLTTREDAIGMLAPVYPPFFSIPKQLKRHVVQLKMDEQNGQYTFNYSALEEHFKQIKLFILCNPHNPIGIVWSKEQLQMIIDLAIQEDVIILSDEIHADLVYANKRYTPLLTLPRAEEAKIISAVSPAKTFNLPGIQAAISVTPNNELKKTMETFGAAHGYPTLNVLATVALEAAYTHGEEWLEQLLRYLQTNIDYVLTQLNAIPTIHVAQPDGTYLLWIDYRDTGFTEKEMMHRLLHQGKLALDPGTKFGAAGNGFLRMNIGCSFETIQDAVNRFKLALQ